MKPGTKLGPWPLGIDNHSPPTALKHDDKGRMIALRDAVNVNIDESGGVESRQGPRLVFGLPELHSLWSGVLGAFAVSQGTLYAITSAAAVPLATLNSNDPCSYDVLNGSVVVGNRTTLLEVARGAARPLAIAAPGAPAAHAGPAGGLAGGRYAVAVSFVRGDQEGALSALATVQLADGQGITLSNLPSDAGADRIRIYRTALGGTVLYHVTDLPMGMPSYLLGNGQLGRDAPTPWLAPMPPGTNVTVWQGRLLLARGRTLVISEPMNYGLVSPRHGFVQFADPITLVLGVGGGVYVGTRRGVVFLRGSKPSEWQQEVKTLAAPVPHCRGECDGSMLPANYQQSGHRVVVWLASNGFVFGTDEGTVFEPQSDRLRVPTALRGTMVAHERRVTATLH